MFFKTLIASIVAALLAGGVVYYGMPAAEGEGSVALYEQEDRPRDRPLGSLFDTYVKKPFKRSMDARKTQTQQPSQPSLERLPVPENEPAADDNTATDPTPPKPKIKPSTSSTTDEGARYYVLENGELREIDSLPVLSLPDALNPDASFKILEVTEQAKQIRQPDLRDRAYLDIVDFAVSNGLYTAAINAIGEIRQVELRDTARSRIAIAYAVGGDTRSAFTLIDQVEVDELQDVLRLQVIEAVILPERLPEAFKTPPQ